MQSFYEVRGTPVDTGVPVSFNKGKRTNAIKKAQEMVRSNDFYYITVRRAGQFIMDFGGQQHA